ncbi:hypothetical protein GMRT_12406 [Giardia muris]|uniref:Uncharacterized protein n=1 Tax=Giardia muris TaxID=5742 RepID=A0A4Z1T2H1_GIAMU|nr:hypothetical protein GMRT_12406 [Giardia muris]|eukprot:TNJ27237.1 hypothetical protein GMRT_12406 [Giardia muris]
MERPGQLARAVGAEDVEVYTAALIAGPLKACPLVMRAPHGLGVAAVALLSPARAVLVDASGRFFLLCDLRAPRARLVATYTAPAPVIRYALRPEGVQGRATLALLGSCEICVVAVAEDGFAPAGQVPLRGHGDRPHLLFRELAGVYALAYEAARGFRVDAYSAHPARGFASFDGPGTLRSMALVGDAYPRVLVVVEEGGDGGGSLFLLELEIQVHRRRDSAIVLVRREPTAYELVWAFEESGGGGPAVWEGWASGEGYLGLTGQSGALGRAGRVREPEDDEVLLPPLRSKVVEQPQRKPLLCVTPRFVLSVTDGALWLYGRNGELVGRRDIGEALEGWEVRDVALSADATLLYVVGFRQARFQLFSLEACVAPGVPSVPLVSTRTLRSYSHACWVFAHTARACLVVTAESLVLWRGDGEERRVALAGDGFRADRPNETISSIGLVETEGGVSLVVLVETAAQSTRKTAVPLVPVEEGAERGEEGSAAALLEVLRAFRPQRHQEPYIPCLLTMGLSLSAFSTFSTSAASSETPQPEEETEERAGTMLGRLRAFFGLPRLRALK